MISRMKVSDVHGKLRDTIVNIDRKVSLMSKEVAIIKVGREEIVSAVQDGNNYILNFSDGTKIIFIDYFVKENKVLIEDTDTKGAYYITNDESGSVLLNGQPESETLLQPASDYHWAAIPAVLAALAIPAIIFGGSKSGSHNNRKDNANDADSSGEVTSAGAKQLVADTTDAQIAEAEAAVKAAEEKQQAAADAAAQAVADG
uniref:BapA/Bap/LapF family prefix-like domain-containing protein n=1 Tax=Pantoea sp. USHLN298 TaxID=3081294 RepID=UPI0030167618